MKADERRQRILDYLQQQTKAISASNLAKQFGVSRQVIVGDIALLRAKDKAILSTPRGYLMATIPQAVSHYVGKIVAKHTHEETTLELNLIVAHGGTVLDVSVEHPIYGLLTVPLSISNQNDIDQFMDRLSYSQSNLLSSLTDGIHIHTISCASQEEFLKIKRSLKEANLLLDENI
ncbi:hypothetical protein HMPREF9318_01251 [Streptococcus urinalis FB127-CNA-2]|uniref:3H domain protein n=1 Tax=Streptococcus urinalis 2285-97 TaxID=764291 RepID=G5KC99_9STRE|nr:transcription repressor NadR [Streptococcus urinalis]EHJ57663.1 3H domain protein [Streptococcus urinalis 2285-97]EKS19729.1 hypothetical protein HMPREF9318_01251 [Streptococcus urinalis FB127-CNA-2]VEF31306.1 transcriptional regulator [Streptococcus urinalis]